ncbi:hypothetical protein AC579_4645 [Pseudocercospora musae]|uniref:DASH complex subunit DAD1 n=1 Tax=Pseudocercospora musae TaxID=113226 RepID=A0A139IBA2_9PEZI|nr:hypothetical protein AC579_4645 [Pseudocercospora musae]
MGSCRASRDETSRGSEPDSRPDFKQRVSQRARSPRTDNMSNSNGASSGQSYFEEQRSLLVQDVAASLDNVLQNLNKLNRSLEGVIAVGNEFGQVEGLWSQFENVMAKEPEKEESKDAPQEGEGEGT